MKKLEGLKKKLEDLMRKIKHYKIPKKGNFHHQKDLLIIHAYPERFKIKFYH